MPKGYSGTRVTNREVQRPFLGLHDISDLDFFGVRNFHLVWIPLKLIVS